jgi:serine/threonine protein kinase
MSDPLNLVGQTIDQFLVEGFIAKGGMAAVYAALDTTLGRRVALKVILPDKANNAQTVARFHREARTVASLSHANIIPIYFTGKTADNLPYLVMEFVEGGTLHDQLQQLARQGRRPTPVEALQQMRKIISALGKMHQAGIVHRDLKPANILLKDATTPLLADLGIARVNDATTKLTRTGMTLGTPAYMSPEQARGEELDGRSDLYTMGVILYEMLSGYLPFQIKGNNKLEYLHHHLKTPPPPLSTMNPTLNQETCHLVDRCLQKEPSLRYQTAEEMLTAVDRAIRAEQNNPASAPFTLPTIKEEAIYQTAARQTAVWWQQPRTLATALVATILIAAIALFALRGQGANQPEIGGGNEGEETAVLPSTSSSSDIAFTDTPTPEPTSTLIPTATPAPPTATATLLPEPTATSTPSTPLFITIVTPIIVQTPTPVVITAVCQQSVGDRWGSTLYAANDDKLGCPLNQPHASTAAFQLYEHGLMVWRADSDWVYVFFNDGSYNNYNSKIAPEGYFDTPDRKGAFGYIWNNYESVRNRIGSPKGAEANASNFVVQDFANGLIFYFLENQANNYVLISNTATWHKQQE